MGSNGQLAKGSRAEVALRHRINAGRVAVRNQLGLFRGQFGNVASEWKGDDTRVTFADFAISEKIFHELRASFPDDDFCSEEGNPPDEMNPLEAPYAWVLDPIDGTNNYFLGIPQCAISLAILHQGVPVYGFVYDYSRDRLVEGGPGFGLTDGNARVTLSPEPIDPRRSIAAVSFPLPEKDLERVRPWLDSYRCRALGSATLHLTYTALGKVDGCMDFKVKVWDMAAGYALILGSGGEFHFDGPSPFPMKAFGAKMPTLRYWGGSSYFCEMISSCFRG